MPDENPLQCYNTSCSQTYFESENNDEACQYHPGKPYFHDGFKEWTCCKRRTRDFATFLNYKGCTKGRHSNVKQEDRGPTPTSDNSNQESSDLSINPETKIEEKSSEEIPVEETPAFIPPDPNIEESIPIIESASLANAPESPKSTRICKNCKQEESVLNMNDPCHYHKGVQIFHDAYKFWSCCQHKKFSDFEDFQKLPPCAQADHHELMVKIDYKENWFQTGGTLTIALYGLKGARYMNGLSKVTLVGGKGLRAHLVNGEGLTIFEKEWSLCDYVMMDNGKQTSKVTINPSNVQIILNKSNEKYHWPTLERKEIS